MKDLCKEELVRRRSVIQLFLNMLDTMGYDPMITRNTFIACMFDVVPPDEFNMSIADAISIVKGQN